MEKLIKKALRLKSHKFYFSPEKLTYGYYLPNCTKIKTKKRLKQLMTSSRFIRNIEGVSSDYVNNLTVIYVNHKGV